MKAMNVTRLHIPGNTCTTTDLMTRSQVYNLKIQPLRLKNVSWSQSIRIYVVLSMRMEYTCLFTIQHRLQPRRIRQPKNAPATIDVSAVTSLPDRQVERIKQKRETKNSPRLLAGRTHDRNTLRHHNLIRTMRMQIPTTHKARLRRMRMDPAQHHQLLAIAVIKQRALIDHLARIARGLLLGEHQLADKQRVRDQRAAQEPARLEVARSVRRR